MVCPVCAAKQETEKPLRGILEVGFEGSLEDHFRIDDLLCVESSYLPSIPVGNTPLWEPARLRKAYGFPKLYLKDDTLNPTGSLKDRASYLVAGFARKHGLQKVVVASTGNAASSMAGVGAAAGLDITLYIPQSAPKAKLAQAYQYGAQVVRVKGSYDKAYEQSLERSNEATILCRNTAYNPLTIDGKKTVSLEIFTQLGKSPGYVFVPAGDGVILSGVYKGFQDLHELGIIEEVPRVFAVQAEGSAAISRALEQGDFTSPFETETIADSISVEVPRGGYYAVKKLRQYEGECVLVSDQEILAAQKELSSTTGLFAEPAAAASFAGFLKVKDRIDKDAQVVLLLTGNGLKDIDAALKLFNE
jgi:threonine synthase